MRATRRIPLWIDAVLETLGHEQGIDPVNYFFNKCSRRFSVLVANGGEVVFQGPQWLPDGFVGNGVSQCGEDLIGFFLLLDYQELRKKFVISHDLPRASCFHGDFLLFAGGW